MDIKVFYFNPLRECCYVVWDETKECALIDPGCYGEREFLRLKEFVEENGLKPVRILLTHGHFDHVFGLQRCYDEWHPTVNIHEKDIFQIETSGTFAQTLGLDIDPVRCPFETVADGDIVRFGEMSLKVIHTPGHTEGGVCYYGETEKVLFSGDTLFQGSVGRTDHPRGDFSALKESLTARLKVLPPEVDVFAGHGYPTTIGTELATNPFMKQ